MVACIQTHTLLRPSDVLSYVYKHFVFHLRVDGHLSCFSSLAVRSNAVIIPVQAFVWTYFQFSV